jgi:methylenetetrahydrofolate dehydrogenase (NADP+)/methenyltetrahydrofolate cyclohydrolase
MIIDGRKIRDEILAKLNPSQNKFLAAVIVGENQASLKFLEEKKKIAGRLGIIFNIYSFPEEIYEEELRFGIKKILEEPFCGGILVQMPLPPQISLDILKAIPAEKDPDALGKDPIMVSPAILVVEEIFERQSIVPEDEVIVVFGKGLLTGSPIAAWLGKRPKELIVIDKGDSPSPLGRADIVISGVGRPKLFSAKQLKSGAGVIDFGTSVSNGSVSGDFDPEGDLEKLSFYTPTPGGTGPILIAKLLENFCELTSRAAGN